VTPAPRIAGNHPHAIVLPFRIARVVVRAVAHGFRAFIWSCDRIANACYRSTNYAIDLVAFEL
jgi:hypothetical protein